MATIELHEGDEVNADAVRCLTKQAVSLDKTYGNPTNI